MNDTKYQLITLGNSDKYFKLIQNLFAERIWDLGINLKHFSFINTSNFASDYNNSGPAVCLYFGAPTDEWPNSAVQLSRLIADATLIVPVVEDLTAFKESIPKELHAINGFELRGDQDAEKLVSVALEGFRLLRSSRRIFISYKRDESSSVAIQLFEALEKSGFDVFLDTHSIRPGDVFQDELWHRMADSDIVVLLNTAGFMLSKWTKEELAKANSMSIGILQLIWPQHKLEREAEICLPINLQLTDFVEFNEVNSTYHLSEHAVHMIIEKAESLRARSIAARHDNLVSEFVSTANNMGKSVTIHHERVLSYENNKNCYIFIPTIGVPQSLTYSDIQLVREKFNAGKSKEAYVLYDQLCIKDKWLQHLDWLDTHLPIRSLKITDSEQWLFSH